MVLSPGTQPTLSECELLSLLITRGSLMGKTGVVRVMGCGAVGLGVMGTAKGEPARGPCLLLEWGCSGQQPRLFPQQSHSGQ